MGQKIKVTTTGFAKEENRLVEERMPGYEVFLSGETEVVLSHWSVFTEKYINAHNYGIPVVSSVWFYDALKEQKLAKHYLRYRHRLYENAVFSTSGKIDKIAVNYVVLLGGVYSETLDMFASFLICAPGHSSQKTEYAREMHIPVVTPEDIVSGRLELLRKDSFVFRQEKKDAEVHKIFAGCTFFIDPALHPLLFTKLKHTVLKNGGTRTNNETCQEITHKVTGNLSSHGWIHYGWILDSEEHRTRLFERQYKIHDRQRSKPVLENTVVCIAENTQKKQQIADKLRALGSRLKQTCDDETTHYIADEPSNIELKNKNTKIVTPSWVDACICSKAHIDEEEYSSSNVFSLSLYSTFDISMSQPGTPSVRYESRNKSTHMIVQFSSIETKAKDEIMENLCKLGIPYIDKNEYMQATHIITKDLKYSEKIICGVMHGCIFLLPSCNECLIAGNIEKIECHTWKIESQTSKREELILKAAQKWRARRETIEKLPFARWNVRIECEKEKEERIRRILLSGGAKICTDVGRPTHTFSDKIATSDHKKKIYPADYIFKYILR